MSDPAGDIRQPGSESYLNQKYVPDAATHSPLVNMGISTMQQMIAPNLQQTPVNVPGYSPTDVYYMNYFGNALREDSIRRASSLSPDTRMLASLMEQHQHSNLAQSIRNMAGSPIHQQLQSHPAMQIVLGGNLPAATNQLLNASQYLVPGGDPLVGMQDVAMRHQRGLAMAAAMNQVHMAQIYPEDVAAPDPQQLMGFRAQARSTIAATMMRRGQLFTDIDPMTGEQIPFRFRPGVHYTMQDGSAEVTDVGFNTAQFLSQRRIEPVMRTLAAGRQVFGEQGAGEMLANIERFFGQDITGGGEAQSQRIQERLEKFAALARSVGEDARNLVRVKEVMERQTAALEGVQVDPITGRRIGGFALEERGIAEAAVYARTLFHVQQNQGAAVTPGQRQELLRAQTEMNAISMRSPFTRRLQLSEALIAGGRVQDPELKTRLAAAVNTGDRFAVEEVMQDISQDVWMDPQALTGISRNERAMRFVQEGLENILTKPQRARASQEFVTSRNALMAEERLQRYQQSYARNRERAARRLARSGGVRLDFGGAEQAGIQAMIETVRGDELVEDEEMAEKLAGQMEAWAEGGVSMRGMQQLMRRSRLFREQGVTPENLRDVAATGRSLALVEQLDPERITLGRQAEQLWTAGRGATGLREARMSVNRALAAGNVDKAKAAMKKFADNLSPEQANAYRASIEGIGEDVQGRIERLGLSPEEEEGDFLSAGKEGAFAYDPRITSQMGSLSTQDWLVKITNALAPTTGGEGGMDPLLRAIGQQRMSGSAINRMLSTAETPVEQLTRGLLRDVASPDEQGQRGRTEGDEGKAREDEDSPIRVVIVGDERGGTGRKVTKALGDFFSGKAMKEDLEALKY